MQQQAVLFNDEDVIDQHHGADVYLPVANAEGLDLNDLTGMLNGNTLPLMVGWPNRDIKIPDWLADDPKAARVFDVYTRLKPRRIGHLYILRFVKRNDSWLLHGRIQYDGKEMVNHLILKPFRLVTQEVDRDRNDRKSGRVLVGFVCAKADPR